MYKIEITNTDGNKYLAKSEKSSLVIDTDGKDALTPVETLLASLGACMAYYINIFKKRNGLEANDFTVSISSELSKNRPFQLNDISVNLTISGVILDEEKKGTLIKYLTSCPVHNTLKSDPSIHISID